MDETNGNAAAYAASAIFVGVGVVYAILLVATALSVLLIPVALAAAPFVADTANRGSHKRITRRYEMRRCDVRVMRKLLYH